MDSFFDVADVKTPSRINELMLLYTKKCKLTDRHLVAKEYTHPWKWVIQFLTCHSIGKQDIVVESLSDIQDGIYEIYCLSLKRYSEKGAILPWDNMSWISSSNIMQFMYTEIESINGKVKFYLKLHQDVLYCVAPLFTDDNADTVFYMRWDTIESEISKRRQSFTRYVPISIISNIEKFELKVGRTHPDSSVCTFYSDMKLLFSYGLYSVRASSETYYSSVDYGTAASEMVRKRMLYTSEMCNSLRIALDMVSTPCPHLVLKEMNQKIDQIHIESLFYLSCSLYQLDSITEAYFYAQMTRNVYMKRIKVKEGDQVLPMQVMIDELISRLQSLLSKK
jgi:hypothetical protein